jgi:hypothetical protein
MGATPQGGREDCCQGERVVRGLKAFFGTDVTLPPRERRTPKPFYLATFIRARTHKSVAISAFRGKADIGVKRT